MKRSRIFSIVIIIAIVGAYSEQIEKGFSRIRKIWQILSIIFLFVMGAGNGAIVQNHSEMGRRLVTKSDD